MRVIVLALLCFCCLSVNHVYGQSIADRAAQKQQDEHSKLMEQARKDRAEREARDIKSWEDQKAQVSKERIEKYKAQQEKAKQPNIILVPKELLGL